jgi:hypothetical protein
MAAIATHGGRRAGAGRPKGVKPHKPPSGEVPFAEARRRKELALAEIRELELAERRGGVVRIETVREEWSHVIGTAKARLMALPSRLAPDLLHENELLGIESRLRSALQDVLDEIAQDVRISRTP